MSTIEVDSWKNEAGTKTYYGAQAWVNFNGTGTVAIRASKNVSSITDNATGDYTVNLTSALADTNYCCVGFGGGAASALTMKLNDTPAKTTTSIRVVCLTTGFAGSDFSEVNVVFFAN